MNRYVNFEELTEDALQVFLQASSARPNRTNIKVTWQFDESHNRDVMERCLAELRNSSARK